jgi:RNA polymerase primary sigma factor
MVVKELEDTAFEATDLELDIEEKGSPPSFKGVASDDVITLYMKEVGTVPLLSAEDEVELALAWRRGEAAREALARNGSDPEERKRLEKEVELGDKARGRLIEANSRLVISIARKYLRRGLSLSDLIQEGNMGLIKAVERFDPDKGHRFSTYATWWIRQAILRAVADQGRTIRLPAHIVDELNKLGRVAKRLAQELGREPSDEELADELDTSPERVAELMSLGGQPLSLETPVGAEEESTLAEFIEDEVTPNPISLAAHTLMEEQVEDALDSLTPREARVLRLRYGLEDGEDYTLEQVGDKLGLTRERIRQIQAQALRRLRHPSRSRNLKPFLN